MIIGNQELTREDMLSYISPEQQPYHMYQSMQDVLGQGLQVQAMQQQPVQQSMDNRTNQWSNNNGK